MSNMVLTNAFVSINSVNLSAFVKSVTLSYKSEMQDDTAMGDTARSRIGSLKDYTVSIEFFQSYAAGAADATLFGIVGSVVPIEFRSSAAAASATNPKYTGSAILETYQPVGGSVGDNLMAPVTMSGVGALTRATS
jgi:hypothetical protein